MAKRLVYVWLSITILLFSSISIYATQYVQGDFFNKEIVINGIRVSNYNLQYPIITYNNTTYLPLSKELGDATGLKSEIDWESRTLKLLKTEVTSTKIGASWEQNGGGKYSPSVLVDMKVIAKANGGSDEELNLGATPVLSVNGTTYLPLRVFKDSKTLAWDYYYDPYFGIVISSKPGIKANSFFPESEARYNKGLVTYMKTYNKSLGDVEAQKMVFAFKRASRLYGINEVMLIAIAKKESNFHPEVVSGAGAVGLMQVMPRTGASFGVTVAQLKEPSVSINIAASMLGSGMKSYNGDTVKTLSAYAYGSPRVNRGNYSTSHAKMVINLQGGINNYLSNNGYK